MSATLHGGAEVTGACPSRGWRGQFGRPEGWFGRLIGQVMAVKNLRMNQIAVELLDVRPDDRVLEIGFGPGTAIQMAAARATRGFVAGVDPSPAMLRSTAARLRGFSLADRVELREGSASRLPYEDGLFTRALAVNSFHHWSDPERDILEVRRVLAFEGWLVLGLRGMPARAGRFSRGSLERRSRRRPTSSPRRGFATSGSTGAICPGRSPSSGAGADPRPAELSLEDAVAKDRRRIRTVTSGDFARRASGRAPRSIHSESSERSWQRVRIPSDDRLADDPLADD